MGLSNIVTWITAAHYASCFVLFCKFKIENIRKEVFIRFSVPVFRELSVCVRVLLSVLFSFPFGFEGGMLDLIILIPDHCLLFTL